MKYKKEQLTNTLDGSPSVKKIVEVEEECNNIFDTSISFKIMDTKHTLSPEDTALVEISDGVLFETIRANKEMIDILVLEDVNSKYNSEAFYAFNRMVTELYEKEFDISEIMTTIVGELGLELSEVKILTNFLMSNHSDVLYQELKGKINQKFDSSLF